MTLKPRVYIAGPMSGGDRIDNLARALATYRELIAEGYAPLCPQLTFFVDGLIKLDWREWLAIDLPWVAVANAVLRLPGSSHGADVECGQAIELGIPVFYSLDELLDGFPVMN